MHAAAFDQLAADYDAAFVATPLGRLLRETVWTRLDALMRPARRILDLGCGTGEDALRLASGGKSVLAIDASVGMIRVAQEKARVRGLGAQVQFACLPIERISELPGSFDGVMSNFGAMNCVPDLESFVPALATKVDGGGRLLWVLMGPYVLWEWGWFLLRADPRRAWRRLGAPTHWRGLRVDYPTPQRVRSLLKPFFRVDGVRPLGVALPPSYAAGWLNRSPRMLRALGRIEQLAQGSAWLAACADHYIIEATRLADGAADGAPG